MLIKNQKYYEDKIKHEVWRQNGESEIYDEKRAKTEEK